MSRGGGVFLNSSRLVIENSTISGNTAVIGGGVYKLDPSATLSVNGSTTVGNVSTDGSAGGFGNVGPVTVTNSIISGNANSDVAVPVSVAWSLISDTTGATVTDLGGNLFGIDPQLGPSPPTAARRGRTCRALPAPSSTPATLVSRAPPPSTSAANRASPAGGPRAPIASTWVRSSSPRRHRSRRRAATLSGCSRSRRP